MLNPASPTSASCLDPTPENLYYPPKRGDYTYFETPPYQLGESPKASLARAADASMLAYARFVQQRMVLADLQGILAAAGYPSVQEVAANRLRRGLFYAKPTDLIRAASTSLDECLEFS
jgi:hypothetical protein